ncbi:hypothetical protein PSPO01_10015 [Paraphaeosphaeria sporulosa]
MPIYYKYYKDKNIPKYFIDTLSGKCTTYITIHLDYSLWVLEKEWERI